MRFLSIIVILWAEHTFGIAIHETKFDSAPVNVSNGNYLRYKMIVQRIFIPTHFNLFSLFPFFLDCVVVFYRFFCSFIQFWSWILIELAVIAVLDAIKTFSTEEMSSSQWEAQPLKMYVAIPLLNEQFQTEYSYKFVNEKVIGSMVVLTTADHYGFNSKFDISGNYIKSHSQTVSIRSNPVIHTTGLMRRWNRNQHELRFGRVHCKWMWMWIEPYTFQIVSSPANSYSTR